MAKKQRKPHLKLKAFRVERALTQEDMAKRIGISINAYILKENGYRDFTLSEVAAMVNEFSLDPNKIFFCD
ncbi:helix-turn-helix transcriptional regulator [Desulforamulus hydrothermalis]|uniref:Putative transcriptional regulator n=1 Tax=Desulforamulus hydrothermalis Lam5 = DSM 18033 TaxID=1121428 RepID=K8E9J4_9FIRM|nr:helix-turn-helix transcriptional regulator [Desulforamulus hydrothermalis]CCO08243.1 putative transcriptional regulator [Desulforamulus hydrothermalis Lam5 = DSM 18033]SHH43553.1 DNA-binding transcriptional regulator, XRE-family HTH domain [Desulforamulus hydrothermalis Lam5 = DSM 18033]